MENLVVNPSFWEGRDVFLTGHTGFKGSWLSLWLKELGANCVGYALEASTEPSMSDVACASSTFKQNITGDIRDLRGLTAAMNQSKSEIVIHMAAQSLVRQSYVDPVATFDANVMGTVNVMEAARNTPSVKTILIVTTDKCYDNKEWVWGYRETDPMGGRDPYSSSKGCAELVSASYRESFFRQSGINLATARAGNVIGGGDWAKDRIVPDAIRAFTNGEPLSIRNPMASRPWQHVLEPLSGYLALCQLLTERPGEFDEAWNFGPHNDDALPVSTIADMMAAEWGEGAKWVADVDFRSDEAKDLKLDCSKADTRLNWRPRWRLEQSLAETIAWYKAWHRRDDMYRFTLQQIERYQSVKENQ